MPHHPHQVVEGMDIATKISKVTTWPLTLTPTLTLTLILTLTLALTLARTITLTLTLNLHPNPSLNPNQVKTVRDNPVEPIKMLKITIEGLEAKDDL